MNRTLSRQSLPWYKTLSSYYKRDEWELYDLKMDPMEIRNLAEKPSMKEIKTMLENRLMKWQEETNDPWRCAPSRILEDSGEFKNNPQCLELGI